MKSTNTSRAKEPNAARSDVCGFAITLSANAKTAGMTIAARAALFNAARSGTAADHMPSYPTVCELHTNWYALVIP